MFWSQLTDITDEILEEILMYSNDESLQDVILKERISTRFGYLTGSILSKIKSFDELNNDNWSADKETRLRVLQRMPQLGRLHSDIIKGWNEDDIKKLAASNQSISLQAINARPDEDTVREFVTYVDDVMHINPLYVYDGDIFPKVHLEKHPELCDLLDKYPHLNMKFDFSPEQLESKYGHLCNWLEYGSDDRSINTRKQYPSVEHVSGTRIGEAEDLNLFPNLKTLDVFCVNPRQLIPHIASSHLRELDFLVDTWDPLDNEPLRVMINKYPLKRLSIKVREDENDDVYYEYPLIDILLNNNNQLTHADFNKFQVRGNTLGIHYFGYKKSEWTDPVVTPEQVRSTLIKFKGINRVLIGGMLSKEYGTTIRNICTEIEMNQRRRKITVKRGEEIINRED